MDMRPVNRMLRCLAERTITRAEARDTADVIVSNAIDGCGRGKAPVSALRALHVVGADEVETSEGMGIELRKRLYEAIDEDWGPGDSSGDLGPRLRWNMSHPGVDALLDIASRSGGSGGSSDISGSGGEKQKVGSSNRSSDRGGSRSRSGGGRRQIALLALSGGARKTKPTTTTFLNKRQVRSWSEKSGGHLARVPPDNLPTSTVKLTLHGSHFGTTHGTKLLSEVLFRQLPNLIVLDLTRCSLDARSLRSLACGLTSTTSTTSSQQKQTLGKTQEETTAVAVVARWHYAAANLETLILSSNHAVRGAPTSRQRRKVLLAKSKGNVDAVPDFDEDLTGVESLGLAARTHPRLHTLRFCKNHLGLDGSRRLLRNLKSNQER